MMPQDGSLLTDEQLMSMPMMMPMMIDGNTMLNMPQNDITKGTLSPVCTMAQAYTWMQTRSHFMTVR